MKTVNIIANDGHTHNLNKTWGIQEDWKTYEKEQPQWTLLRKYKTKGSAQRAYNQLKTQTDISLRVVKINYIWYTEEYKGNKKDKSNWFTKLFRL